MNTKSRATLLGLLVSGMFMAQPALATPFTVTAWATGHSGVSVTGYTNGQGGGFTMQQWTNPGPTGVSNGNPAAGSSFISWCIDLGQYITASSPTREYTLNTSILSATQIADLGRLAAGHLAAATVASGPDRDRDATAFQLAVWEIKFETSGAYNLGTGNFQSLTSTAAHTTAAGWLANLSSASPTAYSVRAYTSTTNQDQITFRPNTGGGGCDNNCGDVPEPATLSLLGIGLMGLGYIRRKSAKAARA